MPMIYANQSDVLSDLQIDPNTDIDAVERVIRLENALVEAFNHKVGHSFGKDATPQTRTIKGRNSSMLILHSGVVSIVAVTVDGKWDGFDYTGVKEVDPENWVLAFITHDGIAYGLHRDNADWTGPVHVTAVWADQGADDVPEDVKNALTVLTVKEYRRSTSSPTDQIGPDGLMVSAPSGWSDPTVKEAINAHTLTRIIV